ncbi:conserved hypothetical protein [Leishmania braziliensis MHOM/BR/75/M2904]|uniref:BRCT domain-containing protein n=2 Tax=Leishmania braziliensis TaxID=5660 RepID=A4HP91_LEIBR|nr:conserved hypothetical protein [Leishmania braziliensis MHOM/BR/75/M2904]CAJ2481422.1 unnamed protein product [Leishmania braziliensis]CAJ2481821.1 unnamed protein product [Leishmania braziliensis]CAM43998.1 conserved hypothetical protein [Leishmania braziliensis MHOM/BR/75/M2904]SYZ70055.1 hypothetical_protein [Leishmania braziliensis MHOM/BR/75/M2904]
MFCGHTFLVSLAASPLTVAELTRNGARVVYDLDDKTPVTCVIIAGGNQLGTSARCSRGWTEANGLPTSMENRIRASRITVVYEHWVHECLRKSRLLLPCRDYPDTIAYDPYLFAGLRFTTTQLPLQLKANIIALMQFYGATYHNHLLDTTNLLVYSHMRLSPNSLRHAVSDPLAPLPSIADRRDTGAQSSIKEAEAANTCPGQRLSTGPSGDNPAGAAVPSLTKLAVARQHGVTCVTPQWVQLCLNAGELQPARSALAPAPLTRTLSPPSTNSSATMKADASVSNVTDANELFHCDEEVEQWISDVLMCTPHSGGATTDACAVRLYGPSWCTIPGQKEEVAAARETLQLAAQLCSSGTSASKTRKRRRAY